MDDNPFDPKHFGLLAGLGNQWAGSGLLDNIASQAHCEGTQHANALGNLFGAFGPTTPADSSFNALASFTTPFSPFLAPPPPTRPFGSLADLVTPPRPPANALYAPPKPIAPETKRKAFFSFHFEDIMRLNNVRNAWKITHPDSSSNRSFYDSSLWGNRKLSGPDAIKNVIRLGVVSTSVVCVLVGSLTWNRRWVRNEIARAIIDGRGLLVVHINNINHHQTKGPHPLGRNPLHHMGLAKLQPNKNEPPRYYLYEMDIVRDADGGRTEEWSRYGDYTSPIKKPAWVGDPPMGYVRRLSADTAEYDYELDNGHRNIGGWIDQGAKRVGR
jgi:hypothetical protein